jgi:hypothetical protein
MFKSKLEGEEFSTVGDADLHRALAAEKALESHLLGGVAVFLFLILLGSLQGYEFIDWHLLGVSIPIYNFHNAIKSKDKAVEKYLDDRD